MAGGAYRDSVTTRVAAKKEGATTTTDAFLLAVREIGGPAWEAHLGPGYDEIVITCRPSHRTIDVLEVQAARANPGRFLQGVRNMMQEMRKQYDPHGAEREAKLAQEVLVLKQKLLNADVELKATRAIISDLFEKAKAGS